METREAEASELMVSSGSRADEPAAWVGPYAVPHTTNDRAARERSLPLLWDERARLIRARTREGDTSGGDPLVLAAAGVASFLALAAAGWLVAGRLGVPWGTAGGLISGALILGLAAAGAAGAVALARRGLERQERRRKDTLAGLHAAIRTLDRRIYQAFLDHGLMGHPSQRPS